MTSSSLTSACTISDIPTFLTVLRRNNHLKLHRAALRDAVRGRNPPVRLLALNWAFEQPVATIHRICSDRVCDRGESHQTLHADLDSKSHEEVIWRFIDQREELEEGEVDAVIEMDINEDLEHAFDRTVNGCVRILGLEKPDQEKVALALAAARNYEPATTGGGKAEKVGKSKPRRYYGFLPEVDLLELLNPIFSKGGDGVVADGRKFFTDLKKNGRIATRPHITIVHPTSLDSGWAKELWDRCSELHSSSTPSTFRFHLGSVVWNDRVMAITVGEVVPVDEDDDEGKSFLDQLPQEVWRNLHITVGTASGDIAPVEARTLMENRKGVKSLQLTNIPKEGRIFSGRTRS